MSKREEAREKYAQLGSYAYLQAQGAGVARREGIDRSTVAQPAPMAPLTQPMRELTSEEIAELQTIKTIVDVARIAKTKPWILETVQARQKGSKEFYQQLGYPQYAGRYEPIEVPQGYRVKSITEKQGKLDVEFEAEPQAQSLTEQIYSGNLPSLNLKGIISSGLGVPKTVKIPEAMAPPVDLVRHVTAGVIAPFERLTYTVANLLGIKTPSPPPTTLGAMMSSGIETGIGAKGETIGLGLRKGLSSALGLPELPIDPLGVTKAGMVVSPELKELGRHDLGYAFGSLAGEILLGYGIAKGAEKLAESGIGQLFSEQFRLHAPKPLLRVVYGAEGAKAIVWERTGKAIESQWGWEPLSEELIGAEKAGQEAAYGMPLYRAETLHAAMPTKEWQRFLYREWFVPRMNIEAELGWELGVSPAFGVAAGKGEVAKGGAYADLTLQDMIKQAEQIPIYKPEKTVIFDLGKALREGDWEKGLSLQDTFSISTGKTTPWSYRGSFEFEQATKMDMPSRLFIPKTPSSEAWIEQIFYGKGTPTTPMETTLSKAIMGEISGMKGGLSATQLMPEIVREFPVQPPTLETMPKAAVKMIADLDLSGMMFSGVTEPAAKVGSMLSDYLGIGLAAAHLVAPRVKKPSRIERASRLDRIGLIGRSEINLAENLIGDVGVQTRTGQTTGQQQVSVAESIIGDISAVPMKPRAVVTTTRIIHPPRIPLFPKLPRRQEDLLGFRRKKVKPSKKFGKGYALFEYPIMTIGDAAKYVLGKKTETRKGRKKG